MASTPVLGTVRITANFLGRYTPMQLQQLVWSELEGNNWDIINVQATSNPTAGYASVTVDAAMHTSMDLGTIQEWFKDDLIKGSWGAVFAAVKATVLTRNTVTNINPVNVGTVRLPKPPKSPDRVVTNLIQDLKQTQDDKPKNQIANDIAKTIGISVSALAILGVVVGVVILKR